MQYQVLCYKGKIVDEGTLTETVSTRPPKLYLMDATLDSIIASYENIPLAAPLLKAGTFFENFKKNIRLCELKIVNIDFNTDGTTQESTDENDGVIGE